jgi:hypothetical protein
VAVVVAVDIGGAPIVARGAIAFAAVARVIAVGPAVIIS